MSHSQFHSMNLFILRHAWLNLWDKHMTTGRINQVTIANSRSLKLSAVKQTTSQSKSGLLGLRHSDPKRVCKWLREFLPFKDHSLPFCNGSQIFHSLEVPGWGPRMVNPSCIKPQLVLLFRSSWPWRSSPSLKEDSDHFPIRRLLQSGYIHRVLS